MMSNLGIDERHFEQLFKSSFKPLTLYAFKILKDVEIAKEIVHQAFIKLWENRQNIDPEQNITAYLYRTVNNLAINYIRDTRKFVSTEQVFDWQLAPEDFEDYLERHELLSALMSAIDSLPKKMKQIFIMSRFDHLSHKQIAEKLQISPKTVENQIGKALKRLRQKLQNFNPKL